MRHTLYQNQVMILLHNYFNFFLQKLLNLNEKYSNNVYVAKFFNLGNYFNFSDPTIDELPPVTVEEYEALRENISKMEIKLYMIRGAIQLQLADHRITGLQRQRKYVESRVNFQ